MTRWFWMVLLLAVVVVLALVAIGIIGDAMRQWGTP